MSQSPIEVSIAYGLVLVKTDLPAEHCAQAIGLNGSAPLVKVLHFLGIGRLPARPMVDATGGTERVALEIARIQVRRGHDVTIASLDVEAWQGTWQGVKLVRLQPYSLFKFQFGRHLRLTNLIRSGHFDLVHLHEYVRTSFFSTIPTVMQFHNNPLDRPDHAEFVRDAPAFWAQVGKSAAQLAVSNFVNRRLQLAHQEAGPDALPANIITNYSGVDLKGLSPDVAKAERTRIRQQLGLKATDVLFLFAGAVRPEKGVDYLARVFARLSEENAGARLAIAGGSRLWIESGWLGDSPVEAIEREVRNILAPAIARRQAFMLGIVSPIDIGAYYAAADVLVLPSMFQETFGLVVLEAFSAGLPVIAFRSGGVPELIDHQRNGLLIDQGDEAALLRSMREVMLARDLRERLGAEARKTATRFSWDGTVDRLDAIYRTVLTGKKISV
jgi:glycosyltransferase involved in cell wall biosynthesis